MRHIQKGASPKIFEDWKNQANENWQPSWRVFRGNEKKAVKKALLEEQGYICCYCGMRIENDRHTEIEHVKPRSECVEDETYKALAFDNFFASCNGSTQEPKPREVHCNNARRNQFLAVSPLTVGCENEFVYTYDGNVLSSKNDDAISHLINDVLKLNAQKVQSFREKIVRALDVDFRDKEDAEIHEEIKALSQKENNRFNPMCFVSISYLQSNFL